MVCVNERGNHGGKMIIGQDHSQRNVTFGLREIAQCHLCELITLHKKIYSCGCSGIESSRGQQNGPTLSGARDLIS